MIKPKIVFIIAVLALFIAFAAYDVAENTMCNNCTLNITQMITNISQFYPALYMTSVTDNGNYTYTWHYSDGNSSTTSNLRGAPGANGTNGSPGTNGTNGSDGADGTPGINGTDGTGTSVIEKITCSGGLVCSMALDGTLSLTSINGTGGIVTTPILDDNISLSITGSGGLIVTYI